MERAMGLEPTTFSLATRRSTTELCPLIKLLLKIVVFLRLSKGQICLVNYRQCLKIFSSFININLHLGFKFLNLKKKSLHMNIYCMILCFC